MLLIYTSEEQITWQPNSDYNEGMIIIKDEVLFVAENDIKTSENFKTQSLINITPGQSI